MPPETTEGATNGAPANTSTSNAPAPAAAPPGAAAPSAGAPAADPVTISMPSDAFKERLGKEREKERTAMLKELGFDKPEDIKAALKIAQDAKDRDLSELQKAQKALKETEPKAQRADHLEKLVAGFVEEQFGALAENVREAIDEVAKGNPEERLRMIGVMRKAGVIGAPAATGAAAPPPPKTLAQNGATPPAPTPKTGPTAFQRFAELEQNDPLRARIFYDANRVEIEKTRTSEP